MLIVGRSRGRPSRLLRRVSVTNSSSSLPTWSDDPMTMLPAACSGVYGVAVLLLKYSGGFRNALSSGSELSVVTKVAGSSSRRATVSSSIECPNRYTACANSAGMAGLMSGWYTWNGLTAGCTLRANSSNTRCWYSISVTKRAAWKSRLPSQPSAGALGSAPMLAVTVPVMVARPMLAVMVSLAVAFTLMLAVMVPVAEAFTLSVAPLPSVVTALTVAPAGMPVPAMAWPTSAGLNEPAGAVSVALPAVVTTEGTFLASVAPLPSVVTVLTTAPAGMPVPLMIRPTS